MQLALPDSHDSLLPPVLAPPPQSRRRPVNAGARIARPTVALHPPARVPGDGRAAEEAETESALGRALDRQRHHRATPVHALPAHLRGAGTERRRARRGGAPKRGRGERRGLGREGSGPDRQHAALTRSLCSFLAWRSVMPSRRSAWENDGGSRRPPPPSASAPPSTSPRALTGDRGQEFPRVGLCARGPRWHLRRVEELAGAQARQQGPRPGGPRGS